MDIQNILSNLIMMVTLGLMIGIVSKTLCDGLLSAWGIQATLLTRLLVFVVNAFLVCEIAYYEFNNLYFNLAFLLLLVCSGAEACYQIITNLKKLTNEELDDIETESQETTDEYELAEGTDDE